MTTIRVIDENGEFKDIDCIAYNIQYVSADGDGRIHKIRALNNGKYGFKHWIKGDIYGPLAKKVKDKFKEQIPEFNSINIDKIFFIEDMDYVGDEVNKNDWVMRIKKAPAQLEEIAGYKFIVESREFWMSRISNEQIIAHIYSVLRQIEGSKLKEPDLKGWKEVIGTLGYGWENTLSPIPNLLDGFDTEDFTMLRKADKQLRFDLREAK